LERFRDGTTVRVEVRSVTFFERGSGAKDLAQVRFARMQKSATGAAEVPTYFIATIQFAYGKPSTDPQQRQWNPLGFRVIDYKVDPEVTPDVGPGGSPNPGAGSGSGSASLAPGGRS
jgi:type IV secretion system protein VirB8